MCECSRCVRLRQVRSRRFAYSARDEGAEGGGLDGAAGLQRYFTYVRNRCRTARRRCCLPVGRVRGEIRAAVARIPRAAADVFAICDAGGRAEARVAPKASVGARRRGARRRVHVGERTPCAHDRDRPSLATDIMNIGRCIAVPVCKRQRRPIRPRPRLKRQVVKQAYPNKTRAVSRAVAARDAQALRVGAR